MTSPTDEKTRFDKRVEAMIEDSLDGLDDFEKFDRLSELIEYFSQDVPAMLSRQRIAWLERLNNSYTRQEVQAGTGLSPNRVRKLIERT